MFNRLSSYCLCILFFVCIQVSCFGSVLDVEEIGNCTDINKKIDYFIEAGMEYQKATGKRFHYKEFLKKTFKYLEDNGIDLPKKLRSDIKRLVHDRIEQGYYVSKAVNDDGSFKNDTMDRYKNEEPESSNEIRGSVFNCGIGVVMMAVPCPVVQWAGGGLAAREVPKLAGYAIDGLANYFYPDRESRKNDHRDSVSNGRKAERERDYWKNWHHYTA